MLTKEEKLQKRREYYAKNRDKIRERDNASARISRQKDPTRYANYVAMYKERHADEGLLYPKDIIPDFLSSPDALKILRQIEKELKKLGDSL